MPFGGYDLWSTFRSTSLDQNTFIYFNHADIWQTILERKDQPYKIDMTIIFFMLQDGCLVNLQTLY